MSRRISKSVRVYSPDFSGAHRCTTTRVVRAPFGESCRRRCPQRAWAKGKPTLPLRLEKRDYPFVQPQNSINSASRVNPDLHALMTMRAIDEDGKGMPKQRKIYILDENGNKIRKGKNYKCKTESVTDRADLKWGKMGA